MRPGQNKRMRGRNNNNNNNRKGPNPLTRSYESNGPDVKIRGTAHHIGEKYLQLARDAQSSGDPVMAESYLQHAEHYFRLIAAAQLAQQQAAQGYQQRPGDPVEAEEDDPDDDFVSLPDRFASPSEQRMQSHPAHQPQPSFPDRQPYSNGGQQQPYDTRPDRPYDRQNGGQPYGERQPSGERQERQYDNRSRGPYNDRPYQDRSGPDRNGQDRNGQDRNGQDRNGQDRQDYRGGQDRNLQDRGGQDRGAQDRSAQDRGPQQPDRQVRDGDARGFRNNRRDFRDPPRDPRPPIDEAPANGLPAFITAPTRPLPGDEPQPAAAEAAGAPGDAAEDSFHMRPRRRRRPKTDFVAEDGSARPEHEPAGDPVGD